MERSNRRNKGLEKAGAILADVVPIRPSATKPETSPAVSPDSPDGCWCAGKGFRWSHYDHEEWWQRTEANERTRFEYRGPVQLDASWFLDPLTSRCLDGQQFCICEAGEALYAEAKSAATERHRAELRTSRLIVWEREIPRRFRAATLASSPLPAIYRTMLEVGEKPESWLFWGAPGRGKTGLAVGYSRRFVFPENEDATPVSLLFRDMPSLLADLRSTYDAENKLSEAAVLALVQQAELVVLDDLGAEQISGSGWLEDRLYQLLGRRHAEMRPTVLTSNLSPEQLFKRLGERIMWRVVEMCGEDHIVEVKGPNLRAAKGARA